MSTLDEEKEMIQVVCSEIAGIVCLKNKIARNPETARLDLIGDLILKHIKIKLEEKETADGKRKFEFAENS